MSADGTAAHRLDEVMADIQMPLQNLAFTLDAYLLANGTRLDVETRFLLAGARDCANRVAGSVRQVALEDTFQTSGRHDTLNAMHDPAILSTVAL